MRSTEFNVLCKYCRQKCKLTNVTNGCNIYKNTVKNIQYKTKYRNMIQTANTTVETIQRSN